MQWKGDRSGPFTELEAIAKIRSGEIGGLYSIECNGREMSAGEFLQAQQAKAPAKIAAKPVIIVKQNSDKTVPIQAREVETINPVVSKAPSLQPQQAPSLPKVLPAPVLPPPAPQADRTSITIARNGETFGPFSKELLTKYIGEGMFVPDDLAWHEGLPTWVRLGDIRFPGQGPTLPALPSYPVLPPRQFPVLPTTQVPQPIQPVLSSPPKATSVISAGYLLCLISLLFFPPVLGLAAFILGIVVIAQGSAGHGIAIILLSIICAIAGMIFGAAIIA